MGRRTQTVESSYFIHTQSPLQTRIAITIIHIDLAMITFEPWCACAVEAINQVLNINYD